MLTKIILDGPMGKKFGKEWELVVNSPSEALRMIDANAPGLFAWIKLNLAKYVRYQVVCEYEDGRNECLSDENYSLLRKCKSIRFVPVIAGAGGDGGFTQTVLGIGLIVVGVMTGQPWMIAMGAGMALGGVAQMLAPKPKTNDPTEVSRAESHYFDGPANTTVQGVPVQLIYGKCLVGSHSISAAVTVDQLM